MKSALILSGCGVFDGTEIHEAVITLLNLQKLNVEVSFFAPNVEQMHCVDHSNGQVQANRNVLVESARIARGEIADLANFDANNFDMLVFPGGFGAAKNLSDFAVNGDKMTVNKDVENAIKAMQKLGKPIAFICISPVIAAKVIGDGVKLTIGNDVATASTINNMGAEHINCTAEDFIRDEVKSIYSTPAYMLASNTVQLDCGIAKMLKNLVENL